jgi:hypothetical protein
MSYDNREDSSPLLANRNMGSTGYDFNIYYGIYDAGSEKKQSVKRLGKNFTDTVLHISGDQFHSGLIFMPPPSRLDPLYI